MPTIKRKVSPAAALALGLASDTATAKDAVLEIAEEDRGAVERTIEILSLALQSSVEENQQMAAQMGEMQGAAQESAAQIADMQSRVAAADSLLVKDAVTKAGLLGVSIACDDNGIPVPRKDGDKIVPVTTDDVYREIVTAKVGPKALDTIPVSSRAVYAQGMVAHMLRSANGRVGRDSSAQDHRVPDTAPAVVNPQFARTFLGRTRRNNKPAQ